MNYYLPFSSYIFSFCPAKWAQLTLRGRIRVKNLIFYAKTLDKSKILVYTMCEIYTFEVKTRSYIPDQVRISEQCHLHSDPSI